MAVVLASSVAAAASDPEQGRALYLKYCQGCHGEDGRGGGHTFMPHADQLSRKGYIDLLPDEYLQQVIAEGGNFVGKSSYMPPWKAALSEQQISDIIAHIRTLPLH